MLFGRNLPPVKTLAPFELDRIVPKGHGGLVRNQRRVYFLAGGRGQEQKEESRGDEEAEHGARLPSAGRMQHAQEYPPLPGGRQARADLSAGKSALQSTAICRRCHRAA